MIWPARTEERYYRWRRWFAWRPFKVGEQRVWLEWCNWRQLRYEERPQERLTFPLMASVWFEEWQLSNGYTVRCKITAYIAAAPIPPDRSWYRVTEDREIAYAM